jgi:acylphosphatase
MTTDAGEARGSERPIRRVHATVQGYVQGVGFRWFVQRTAERLGLTGWVANRSDGSVELDAEGPEAALDALIAAVREGPSNATVARVDVERGAAAGRYASFGIRAGSHPGD